MAQYRTFEALRDACTFTLVVPVYSPEQNAAAQSFAGKFSNIQLKTVCCFEPQLPPTPFDRMWRVARRLIRPLLRSPRGWTHPASIATVEGPWYPFYLLPSEYLIAVEESFLEGCDIFQAEFAEMLTIGPLMTERVPTVFVHHQLHHVYSRRFMEANGVTGVHSRYIDKRIALEECSYLNSFDSVIVFSGIDREILKGFCSSVKVDVSPFPSPEEPLRDPPNFARACTEFVFVASDSHSPNVEGLRWFMGEVWPSVRNRIPGATIEVIGNWSSAAKLRLPNQFDIQFRGFVPELRPALERKIMIVPVWVGSGIRTKILAAWAAGCPVVTTTVGVEGLPGASGEDFIIADGSLAFADACVSLSQNVQQLNHISGNGWAVVQRYYSLDALKTKRLEIYEKLVVSKGKQ